MRTTSRLSPIGCSRRHFVGLALGATAFPTGCLAAAKGVATLEQFGGGTDALDNTEALVDALAYLAARGGGTVAFGEGHYAFASAALAQRSGIEVPSNIVLAGRGKSATQLAVTGDAQCYFLMNERGGSHHLVTDLTARGNGVSHGNGPAGFYYCSVLRGSATADVVDCRFRNVRLENFAGDFWIRFFCTSPAHAIRQSGIDVGCEAISQPGNARGPDILGVTTFVVEFRGDGGLVSDCFVRGLHADLTWVKGGVAAFGSVSKLSISDVRLDNAFMGYRVPDKGAYAILLYDTSSRDIVTGTVIERPMIVRPFSCGLYLAGTRDTIIVAPTVSGQSDTADGTLPKGAISLNGVNRLTIDHPVLSDNACDIQICGISGPEYDSNMGIKVVGGSGTQATLAGIKIRSSAYALTCGGIEFDGYRSMTQCQDASGMVWQLHPNFRNSGTPSGVVDVKWTDGECAGGPGGYDINLNIASNDRNPSGGFTLEGMTLSGRNVRASFVAVGCAGGAIRLANVKFAGQAHRHIDVRDCAGLVLDGVEFTGRAEDGVHMLVSRTPHAIQRTSSATADSLAQFTS